MPIPDTDAATVAQAVAREAQSLAPGPLAELRRMDEDGAPCFWRLAARHPTTIGNRRRQHDWIAIVRMIAVLTPKGDPDQRPPLHDPARRLGAVLCDGGDPDPEWSGPRPQLSERRVTQLIAARRPQRAVLLQRAVRALARSRPPDAGVNVVDLAWAVLKPTDSRQLADSYYRRLDTMERRLDTNQTQGAT